MAVEHSLGPKYCPVTRDTCGHERMPADCRHYIARQIALSETDEEIARYLNELDGFSPADVRAVIRDSGRHVVAGGLTSEALSQATTPAIPAYLRPDGRGRESRAARDVESRLPVPRMA